MPQTTAELAECTHARMQRQPVSLEIAKPIADRFIASMAERLPGLNAADVAAVLLHASSFIGTEVLVVLADEEMRADRFHLLTANAMAVAGEQLHSALPKPGPKAAV